MTEAAGPDQRQPGDAPDMQQLARDWITLWQSELAALAVDREAQEGWQALLSLWAGAAAACLQMVPRATPPGPHERADGRTGPSAAPRATAAAAAPDPRDAEIDRLRDRLAALESRLAELERGGGDPGGPGSGSGSAGGRGRKRGVSRRSPGRKPAAGRSPD